jgi:hypothetical protein
MQYHNVSERKVGVRRAQKLWRLDGVGAASRIVSYIRRLAHEHT